MVRPPSLSVTLVHPAISQSPWAMLDLVMSQPPLSHLLQLAATASAVLDGVGRVNRVSFTQRGLFNIESSGSVSFTASAASTPTTAATGTYTMRPVTGRVTSFTVSNGGSGYGTTAPAVTVSGSDPATATAVLTSGVVTSINVVYHGSGYTAAPTVTIAAPSSGVQATATAAVTDYTGKFEIASVTMTEQGANYTSATPVFAGAAKWF